MTDEAESSIKTAPLGAPVVWHSIMTALTRSSYTFDGTNYSSWSTTFMEFLNAHRLRHHLTDLPPAESDPSYAEWSYFESAVCTWLCQSVEGKVMQPISTTRPARALWQCLATMYTNKSNVNEKVRLYEALFACKQGLRSLQEYYGAMESIITDLTVYQPASTDPDTLTRYRDELRAGAFLSGLKRELANMIRGQVVGGSRAMPIDEIFSAAIRVHDSVPPSSISSSVDASALVVSRGSGGPPKSVGKGASMPMMPMPLHSMPRLL